MEISECVPGAGWLTLYMYHLTQFSQQLKLSQCCLFLLFPLAPFYKGTEMQRGKVTSHTASQWGPRTWTQELWL